MATELDKLARYGGPETLVPEQQAAPVGKEAETVSLREAFSDEEKRVLKEDGAVIYALTGTTIPAQRELQAKKGKPSFWYVVEAGDRLLALPSRKIEVAIFPDPQRFFVPDSFGKDTDT